MSESIPATVARLRAAFDAGALKSYEARQEKLSLLAACIRKYQPRLIEALHLDLGKPESEAWVSEIAVVEHELHLARKHLRKWMKAKCMRTPVFLWPGRSRIHFEPLGLVLVIAPWNYPVQLALAPLIGAIAAGNTAIVKPSEIATHTSEVLAQLLQENFSDVVGVVTGGVGPTTELLEQRFDHIFFTGSTKVGRIVYEAAAKHLTPTTLELGGKSPTFVGESADLDLAARRIAWGKFMNAGQTCVAPDYVYVHSSVEEKFLIRLRDAVLDQLGDTRRGPNYGRIINTANFVRLSRMLKGASVFSGGGSDANKLWIEPTILRNSKWTDNAMEEEIFGPILPILTFDNFDRALDEVRKRDKPLSAYLFSDDASEKKRFVESLSFGGGCINDTIVHLINPNLPFGGVGASGIGAYHGQRSFLTFSHQKSVVRKSKLLDLDVRYPPFSKSKRSQFSWLFRIAGWLD